MADVIGIGWDFPFNFDDNGRVSKSSDQPDGTSSPSASKQHLYEGLYQLIQTAIGERLMRTNLGCGIHDFVFEVNDETLLSLILYYVSDAIARWDYRVDIIGIDGIVDQGTLKATLSFKVRNTQEVNNLVIPLVEGV